MKKLTFEQDGREPRQMERVRQSYLNRMKDVAIIGAAIFTLGGCASSITNPLAGTTRVRPALAETPNISLISRNMGFVSAKDGVSPTASSVEIGGRTLEIVRLDTRLAELDGQTARYREPEAVPTQPGGRYSNSVSIPNEVRFTVTLSPNEGVRALDFSFPRGRDTNPTISESAGFRTVNLNDFAGYVQRVSGQDMARVNFIVETGTFNNNGTTTAFANAYIFPLNSAGQPITRRGNGEYIVYAASFYSNRGGGSVSLIVEPENRDTLYART